MKDYEFWLKIRQALLMAVDAIECAKLPALVPTSDIRREYKEAHK